MTHFIKNDGGRGDIGGPGARSDCVARAIAIATEQPYAKIYFEVAQINFRMPKTARRAPTVGIFTASKGIYTNSALFKNYMRYLGFVWTPTMHIGSGCRVHLRRGELPMGRLVVKVSRHYTAVIDGVIHDLHDCSRGGMRCVYGYWKKREG